MLSVNPSTLRSRKRRALMTSSERTAETSFYATKRRRELVRILAPDQRCGECGDVCYVDALEIDHVNGRLWLVEDVSPSVRVARYWKEHRAGVPLRVLCKPCSGRDGGSRRYHGAR